jgi:hypothetical protein
MQNDSASAKRIENWPKYLRAAARPDVQHRIMRRVTIVDSGCWIWSGSTNGAGDCGGYAVMGIDGTSLLVHRLSLLVANGEFDPVLDVDHKCRQTRCVNPDHLEAVTHAINQERGKNGRKDFCARGHAMSGANVENGTSRGRPIRRCRACSTVAAHERGKRRPSRARSH